MFWKHSWKSKDLRRKSTSLSLFCCLLLIRNVLTEVFGCVVALNFHVWPGNGAASSLSLYSVSSWSAPAIWVPVFTGTPRFHWKTKILHYLGLKQGRLIYFSRKITVKMCLICGVSRPLRFCYCCQEHRRSFFQSKVRMNIEYVRSGNWTALRWTKYHGQWLARNACAQALAAYTDLFQGDKQRESEVGGQLNEAAVGIDQCLGNWEYTLLSKSVWVGFFSSFPPGIIQKKVYKK